MQLPIPVNPATLTADGIWLPARCGTGESLSHLFGNSDPISLQSGSDHPIDTLGVLEGAFHGSKLGRPKALLWYSKQVEIARKESAIMGEVVL